LIEATLRRHADDATPLKCCYAAHSATDNIFWLPASPPDYSYSDFFLLLHAIAPDFIAAQRHEKAELSFIFSRRHFSHISASIFLLSSRQLHFATLRIFCIFELSFSHYFLRHII
jgi:hypothetical protein